MESARTEKNLLEYHKKLTEQKAINDFNPWTQTPDLPTKDQPSGSLERMKENLYEQMRELMKMKDKNGNLTKDTQEKLKSVIEKIEKLEKQEEEQQKLVQDDFDFDAFLSQHGG